MNSQISKGYPHDRSNEDLIQDIKDFSKDATAAIGNKQYVVGPSYWKEMCELGQNELTIRIQKELTKETSNLKTEINKLKENNRKSNQINRSLSVVTIILAGVTLFIGFNTLKFAETDQISDTQWQTSQLELLTEQNRLLKAFSNDISQSVTSNILLNDSIPK